MGIETSIKDEFVGRSNEIALVEALVRNNKRSELISVSGIGGVGKSWFTVKLFETFNNKYRLAVAYIDLRRASSDYAYLVDEIGEQLNKAVFKEVKNCIKAFSDSWKEFFYEQFEGKLPTQISIHLDHNIFQGPVGDVVGIKFQDVQISIPTIELERIEREIKKSVTAAFINGLQTLLMSQSAVIVLDGFEAIEDPETNRTSELANNLQELLLSCLKMDLQNKLFVVIGRRKPADWALLNRDWRSLIRNIKLDHFSWTDFVNYYEQRGLIAHLSEGVLRKLWSITKGHPQCVALSSDLVEELKANDVPVTASHFDEYVGEFDAKLVTEFLIKRILEKIPEDLAGIIEKASVPHYFDSSILAKIYPGPFSHTSLLEQMKRFSFISRARLSKGYVFHDIVRDLLLLKLTQDDEQGLKQIHRTLYHYFVSIYEDIPQGAKPLEQQGILAEIIYHELNYNPEVGLQRFHSVYNFGERSYQISFCDQLVSIFEQSPAVATPKAWLLYYKARLAYIHNDWQMAQNSYEEITRGDLDDDLLLANVHEALGSLKQSQGLLDDALQEFQQSLILHEKLDDVKRSIRTLNEMGTAYRTSIQWTPSIECYQKALSLADSANSDELLEEQAYSCLYLGVIYTGLGKYEDALSCYDKSREIYEKVGDRYGIARVQQRYGWLARIRGQFDKALDHHIKALKIFRELGFFHSLAECLHSKGTVHRVRKEYELAIQHYDEAINIFRSLKANRHVGLVLNDLGLLYQALNRYQRALDCFKQSLEIKLASRQEREASTTLNNIGDIYIQLSQWEEAEENLNKSVEIARQIDCPINVVRALTSFCELNYKRNTFDQISNYAEEATWLGEKDGYNHYVARVYKIYALAYYKNGYFEDAVEAFSKLVFFAYKYNISFMIDLVAAFDADLDSNQKASYASFLPKLLHKINSLEMDQNDIKTIESKITQTIKVHFE